MEVNGGEGSLKRMFFSGRAGPWRECQVGSSRATSWLKLGLAYGLALSLWVASMSEKVSQFFHGELFLQPITVMRALPT
jgi:hypothetical protein